MEEKSIIIIGAGLAGLSAGCYARMNGYETRIFEMHNIPGGLCTSWKRKGYIFDGCIHYMMGSRTGVQHRLYEELGAVQGRPIIDNNELLRVEGTGGKTWIVYSNIDRLEKHMKEISPADADTIEILCNGARRVSSFDIPVEKPMEQMGLLDMLKLLKNAPALKIVSKSGKTSMQEFATRFKDPFLREVFPLIIEDIPDMPMTGVYFTLGYLHNRNNGWPKGGSLDFSRAIEKRFCDLGGKVQYKTRVEKILIDTNQAVGVRLSDGTEHFADFIISAADGRTTIFDMLDGKYVNEKTRAYYEEGSIYEPYVQISLGVARDFSQEPHSIILGLNEPIVIGNQKRRWIPIKHYCYDPTMAPAGKSVLTASFLFSSYEYWKELSLDREKYKATKESLANKVIDQLENRFPGLKEQIEVVDIATPVTYERYTGNWRGSYMGWRATPSGMIKQMRRTLPGLNGFYMAGQWVYPGGGVSGSVVSGRHAIQTICKKDKKRFVTTLPPG